MEKRETFISQSPSLVEIDTSNICNLVCQTCRRARPDYVQEKKKFLSLADFKTIITKIPELNRIQFCGSSEPTLNKELPEMIKFAKERGAKTVEMFTNGTNLEGEVLKRLVHAPLDVLKVSIDGGDAETYRRIRGADLNRVIRNIALFHKESPVEIGVESVLSKQTAPSIARLPAVVAEMGGNFLEIRLLNWVDSNLKQNSLYDKEVLTQIKADLTEICKQRGIELIMFLPDEQSCNVCATFSELYVDYKGDVTPCYFLDRIVLGNLLVSSFQDVWNGENIKMYRENYLKGRVDDKCCCGRALIINKKVEMD